MGGGVHGRVEMCMFWVVYERAHVPLHLKEGASLQFCTGNLPKQQPVRCIDDSLYYLQVRTQSHRASKRRSRGVSQK